MQPLVFGQLPHLALKLDDSFPESVRSDLVTVSNDVAAVVAQMFTGVEPPVNLPILCHVAPDGIPRTMLDNWQRPNLIRINLSVTERFYAQLAFQLSHELAHVMMGPRRTSAVFETLAAAVSLEVLERLSVKWRTNPPHPHWTDYSSSFDKYRLSAEEDAISRLGILQPIGTETMSARQAHWEKVAKAQGEIHSENIVSIRERDLQVYGAMILRSETIRWTDIVNLEFCTDPNPSVEPLFQVRPLVFDCVRARAGWINWLVGATKQDNPR